MKKILFLLITALSLNSQSAICMEVKTAQEERAASRQKIKHYVKAALLLSAGVIGANAVYRTLKNAYEAHNNHYDPYAKNAAGITQYISTEDKEDAINTHKNQILASVLGATLVTGPLSVFFTAYGVSSLKAGLEIKI